MRHDGHIDLPQTWGQLVPSLLSDSPASDQTNLPTVVLTAGLRETDGSELSSPWDTTQSGRAGCWLTLTLELYPGGEFEEREVVVGGVGVVLGVEEDPADSELVACQGTVVAQVEGELVGPEVVRGAVGGSEDPLVT